MAENSAEPSLPSYSQWGFCWLLCYSSLIATDCVLAVTISHSGKLLWFLLVLSCEHFHSKFLQVIFNTYFTNLHFVWSFYVIVRILRTEYSVCEFWGDLRQTESNLITSVATPVYQQLLSLVSAQQGSAWNQLLPSVAQIKCEHQTIQSEHKPVKQTILSKSYSSFCRRLTKYIPKDILPTSSNSATSHP